MIFRKACENDLDAICVIISEAVDHMLAEGRQQWTRAYPARSHIDDDIACGRGYVLDDGGVIVAYGAVAFTGEPAYDRLDGSWLSGDVPYVVLHRLAVARNMRGRGLSAVFMCRVGDMARDKGVTSFRVDTNFDNVQMLRLMDRLGFVYCGDVLYESGSRRAYEKIL